MKVAFKPGDRVRYRFMDRDTGTVVRPILQHGHGDYYVRWDHDPHGPGLVATYAESMELIQEACGNPGKEINAD